jgi:hypothetical protein
MHKRMNVLLGAHLVAAVYGLSAGLSGENIALAYTDQLYACQGSKKAPWMHFKKGDAPHGTLYVYYSTTAYCGAQTSPVRRKIIMVSGSGDGTSDSCVRNHGWLPNGTYSPRYEKNHQTDSAVVKGSVWYLGDKACSSGRMRTELFIHSQGGNGGSWSDRNYTSNGCIKINQTDRSYLAKFYNLPVYGASSTSLDVD